MVAIAGTRRRSLQGPFSGQSAEGQPAALRQYRLKGHEAHKRNKGTTKDRQRHRTPPAQPVRHRHRHRPPIGMLALLEMREEARRLETRKEVRPMLPRLGLSMQEPTPIHLEPPQQALLILPTMAVQPSRVEAGPSLTTATAQAQAASRPRRCRQIRRPPAEVRARLRPPYL